MQNALVEYIGVLQTPMIVLQVIEVFAIKIFLSNLAGCLNSEDEIKHLMLLSGIRAQMSCMESSMLTTTLQKIAFCDHVQWSVGQPAKFSWELEQEKLVMHLRTEPRRQIA